MTQRLQLKTIDDKATWEAFVSRQSYPQFMQSWNAGEQAKTMGKTIVRFALMDGERVESVCFGEVTRAKRGSFLFVPYGPVFDPFSAQTLEAWTTALREWGKGEKLDFIRFCPFLPTSDHARAEFTRLGYQTSAIHTLAEYLWLLDIDKDEQTLMAAMSKTTRNLIRRSQKDGVRITMSTSPADVDKFLHLHNFTKDRHQFTPYPDALFYTQVKSFAADNQVVVFCAYHGDTLIASSIVMYYGAMASYHHGASIPSKIPAAYALQWAAITEAKRRGCRLYNFWGVTDLSDTKHPFYGISLFKTRFGGYPLTLLPSQDYPLSAKYRLTRLVETIRRIRRGFGWHRA